MITPDIVKNSQDVSKNPIKSVDINVVASFMDGILNDMKSHIQQIKKKNIDERADILSITLKHKPKSVKSIVKNSKIPIRKPNEKSTSMNTETKKQNVVQKEKFNVLIESAKKLQTIHENKRLDMAKQSETYFTPTIQETKINSYKITRNKRKIPQAVQENIRLIKEFVIKKTNNAETKSDEIEPKILSSKEMDVASITKQRPNSSRRKLHSKHKNAQHSTIAHSTMSKNLDKTDVKTPNKHSTRTSSLNSNVKKQTKSKSKRNETINNSQQQNSISAQQNSTSAQQSTNKREPSTSAQLRNTTIEHSNEIKKIVKQISKNLKQQNDLTIPNINLKRDVYIKGHSPEILETTKTIERIACNLGRIGSFLQSNSVNKVRNLYNGTPYKFQVTQNKGPVKSKNVFPVTQNKEPVKTTNVFPVTQNKEPAKSTKVFSVTQNKEPAKSINVFPVTQNKEPAKSTKVFSVTQNKELAKSTNVFPVKQNKEPAKSSNVFSVTQNNEPAKSTNVFPVTQNKDHVKSINVIPVTQNKEPVKSINVIPVTQNKDHVKSINVIPVTQNKEPVKSINVNPVTQNKEPVKSINVVEQKKSSYIKYLNSIQRKQIKTENKPAQGNINEYKKSTTIEERTTPEIKMPVKNDSNNVSENKHHDVVKPLIEPFILKKEPIKSNIPIAIINKVTTPLISTPLSKIQENENPTVNKVDEELFKKINDKLQDIITKGLEANISCDSNETSASASTTSPNIDKPVVAQNTAQSTQVENSNADKNATELPKIKEPPRFMKSPSPIRNYSDMMVNSETINSSNMTKLLSNTQKPGTLAVRPHSATSTQQTSAQFGRTNTQQNIAQNSETPSNVRPTSANIIARLSTTNNTQQSTITNYEQSLVNKTSNILAITALQKVSTVKEFLKQSAANTSQSPLKNLVKASVNTLPLSIVPSVRKASTSTLSIMAALSPSKKFGIITPMEVVQDFVNLVNVAKKNRKTFTVCGNFYSLRRAFAERGWIEKMRLNIMDEREAWKKIENLSNFELVHGMKDKENGEKYRRVFLTKLLAGHQVDFYWDYLTNPFTINNDKVKRTMINRFPYGATRTYTTKHGLCESLKEANWYCIDGYANILFPRTYNLAMNEDLGAFIDDFRITAVISLLEWVISNVTSPDKIISEEGEVPTSVYNFATIQCHNFIKSKEHKDIDEVIPEAKEYEWDVFLEKYYKIVHNDQIFKINDRISAELMIEQARYVLKKIRKYLPYVNTDGHRNIWLLKPNNGSRGSGIHVCRTLKYMIDTITTRKDVKYVVQKYIERPLLIHKTKFDIRQWFLVSCMPNLKVWLYKECYLRFSSQMFDLNKLHESIHLTNNSIQSRYKNNNQRSSNLPDQNMWDSEQFRKYLIEIGQPYTWRNVIYKGIKECLIGLFMLCQDKMELRINSFELCGADFMLSEDYHPYLIEINSRPALYPSTKVTSKMCPKVLEDVIKVIIDNGRNPKAATGEFELIYSDSFNYSIPRNVNSLSVEGISYFTRYIEQKSVVLIQPSTIEPAVQMNGSKDESMKKLLNIDPSKVKKDVRNTLEKILAVVHGNNKGNERRDSMDDRNQQFRSMLSEFVKIISNTKNLNNEKV